MTMENLPCGISALRLRQLQALIAAGAADRFYDWSEWEEARNSVLRIDNWECQTCKVVRRFRKVKTAKLVHHVKPLKERPDLALSVFDPATGERQLVSLCRACHEEQHPERMRKPAPRPAPITEERWD